MEKQTSYKELSEKLNSSCSAAVSGQPGAGNGNGNGNSKSKPAAEEGKPAAPDGGCLAWAIVAASFMVSFLQVSSREMEVTVIIFWRKSIDFVFFDKTVIVKFKISNNFE